MHVVRRLLARLQGATLHTGFVVEVCGSRQALSALRVDRQPGAPAVPGHACEPMGAVHYMERARAREYAPTHGALASYPVVERACARTGNMPVAGLPRQGNCRSTTPAAWRMACMDAWWSRSVQASRRAMPQRFCSGVPAPRPRHCVWCRLTSPVSTGSISYLSASLKSYHPKHCSCWHAALRYFFFCCGTALLLMHA